VQQVPQQLQQQEQATEHTRKAQLALQLQTPLG
jgi:hypothetical protein